MNLWVIFVTGLTVGGLTCLAVQGGLLASVIAAREENEIEHGENKKSTVYPTLAFLLAKFITYTALGFLLGLFGSAVNISQKVQIGMQLAAGVYMVAVALNLLNVHPIFRYVIIQPPKFLTRLVRNQSKSKDLFAPAFLGAMTIFIPCGTTVAMEALAISSANPFYGAAILGIFILGTTPLFFGVGWVTSYLGDNFRNRFLKIASFGIMYLGIMSINGSLVAVGSPVTLGSIVEYVQDISSVQVNEAPSQTPATTQKAEIFVEAHGYSPGYIRVKKDTPVTVTLVGKGVLTCASAFRVPSLGISKNLGPNETFTFSFTPKKEGKIPFTCSMGMYTGVFEVI